MTPLLKWGGIALLIAGCAWATLHFMGSHETKKAAVSEAQAHVQQVAATQAAAQGAANVQTAQAQAQIVAVDDTRVAADLARRAHQPRPVPPPPAPGAPDPQPVVPPAPVDDGTAQLIADQAKEIVDLKAQVNTLALAVGHYKSAYEDAQKEADLREIALQAQIAANKSSVWRGRIEGFVIGIGTGYVAGKF